MTHLSMRDCKLNKECANALAEGMNKN